MKLRTIVVGACGLLACFLYAEDALKVDLKKGASVKYKVKLDQTNEMQLPTGNTFNRGSSLTMSLLLTLGDVDETNKKAAFEAKMSDIVVNGPAVPTGRRPGNENAITAFPKEMVQHGTITARHEIKTDTGQVEMSGMMRMMSATPTSVLPYLNLHFPDKGVKIGDTWEMPSSPGIELGAQESKMTARLQGEKKYRGADVWEVQIKGNVPLKQDLAALFQQDVQQQQDSQDRRGGGRNRQPPSGNMSGTTTLQVKVLVDKKTGLVLYLDGTTKSVTTTTMQMRGRDVQTSAIRASRLTMQTL